MNNRERFAVGSRCRLAWLASVLSLAGAWSNGVHAAEVRFHPVAFSGDPAPDVGGGAAYQDFSSPTINDLGEVLFRGTLTGEALPPNRAAGLWKGKPGELELTSQAGAEAPGLAEGVVFREFIGVPNLNNAGQVLFEARVSGPGIVGDFNDRGLWLDDSEGLRRIASTDAPVPGSAGSIRFNTIESPIINPAGVLAFTATLKGSGITVDNDYTMWWGRPEALRLVAREGVSFPGAEPGVRFRSFSVPVINPEGEVCFHGLLSGAVNFTNWAGIWLGIPGRLQTVARAGAAAPGTTPPAYFAGGLVNFGAPRINANGTTAFPSLLLSDGTPNPRQDFSVWTETDAGLSLLARQNDEAPVGTPGVRFRIMDQPVINREGEVVFFATLEGEGVGLENDASLWLSTDGELQLLAREGSPAPGTADALLDQVTSASMNSAGEVVFGAGLKGGSVTPDNDFGLWAWHQGTLRLLVRTGDSFPVGDPASPEIKTVAEIEFANTETSGSGGEDGSPQCINSLGEIALVLRFTDGSAGVFLVALNPDCATPSIQLAKSADMLVISWPSDERCQYQLQLANSLTAPARWINAGPMQPGTGETISQPIAIVLKQRYFRLVVERQPLP